MVQVMSHMRRAMRLSLLRSPLVERMHPVPPLCPDPERFGSHGEIRFSPTF